MSLLVFNCGTKLAQSIISSLYSAGVYEKIICADVFPAYHNLQQFFKFKDNLLAEVKTDTQLQQLKIIDKLDLKNAINVSTEFLYITHDYYTQVPCKNNLLRECSQMTAESSNIKQFVAVTPIELINYHEKFAQLESRVADREARFNNPKMINIKPDLMFGDNSIVVNKLMAMIVQKWPIYIEKMPSPEELYPIHSDDVVQIIIKILTNSDKTVHQGKNYIAKGKQHFGWNEIFTTLEDSFLRPYKANLKQHKHLTRIVTPRKNNLISEQLWQPFYRNIIQLMQTYEKPKFDKYSDVSEFQLELKGFEKTYAKKTQYFEQFLREQLKSECKYSMSKNLFY